MLVSNPGLAPRWSDAAMVPGNARRDTSLTIGVLPGEGVGPEIIEGTLEVLRSVEETGDLKFDLRFGGSIGRDAELQHGAPLSVEVVNFCREVFDVGGAILNGPGGGRYVYDLRKRFDLFFKISPLVAFPELEKACRLKEEAVRGTDILLVRENVSGIYQGSSSEGVTQDGRRFVRHSFTDDEAIVRRFLEAAARLAMMRRGEMTVVCKDSGVPRISALWRDCAEDIAAASGVRCKMMDIDLIAYRLIQHPREFDVIAAPNLCGDVLADLGAVLSGSRGVSYSGNYAPDGSGVYQTNHGAAYDLTGSDRANPAGQICSLAMLLRESFGLKGEAARIESAVRRTWAAGWRTEDVVEPGCQLIGTREMCRRIVACLEIDSPHPE